MGRIITLVRYRFFLFAGLLPYALGTGIAFRAIGSFNALYFWIGLSGMFFVFAGVETFNEYFDYKYGGDRIFSKKDTHVPDYVFCLGLLSFGMALLISIYFILQGLNGVLVFSILGFLAAAFYVGPPIKWAYRGMGEIIIAVSYGPLLVFGSYYLQAKTVDFAPLTGSLICGLIIFSLSLINEIPDFFQDRLIGKRNLVVRMGREKAIRLLGLTLILAFVVLGAGIISKKIPLFSLAAFLVLPFILKALKTAEEHFERPLCFTSAIKTIMLSYVLVISFLGITYILG